MTVYKFDGTIEGFFTAAFDLYKGGIAADIISGGLLQTEIAMQIVDIKTQKEKAERIRRCLLSNIKSKGFYDILLAFKSSNQKKYNIIYEYLKVVFQHKKDAPYMLSDKRVIDFFNISRQVALECHRMHGFIRFKECGGGIYYADYAPDNDITDFIMPHFIKRFSSMPFIIHDVKRNIAAIYNKKEYKIFNNLDLLTINLTESEQQFLKIWKMYYKTVSIKQRKNTALMKRFMPVRYWNFMPEKRQED